MPKTSADRKSVVEGEKYSCRGRHTRYIGDWSSDVCSSDLIKELDMNYVKWLSVAAVLAIAPTVALPDEALEKDAQDANQWVLPLGSYGGIRHSKLTQINAKNVGRSEERRGGREV